MTRAGAAPRAALLVALAASSGAAQQGRARPELTVVIAPKTVTVGEPFSVVMRVRAAAGATIHFPAVPDTANGVEATDPRAIADSSTAEQFDQTAVYRFIAWQPGRRDVPIGEVRWEQARGAETLAMEPLRVEVASVLPVDTTTQQLPRGARDMLGAPPLWWKWGVAAVALLAMGLMIWWARRRRVEHARHPDAFADAQAAFQAIDELAFADAGEPGRAILAYADVVRSYLSRRFPAGVEGLTSREYVRALSSHDLPILPDEVLAVLETADAVKFAGVPADATLVKAHANAARSIVRDVQVAYEARLAALDKGKGQRGKRRAS